MSVPFGYIVITQKLRGLTYYNASYDSVWEQNDEVYSFVTLEEAQQCKNDIDWDIHQDIMKRKRLGKHSPTLSDNDVWRCVIVPQYSGKVVKLHNFTNSMYCKEEIYNTSENLSTFVNDKYIVSNSDDDNDLNSKMWDVEDVGDVEDENDDKWWKFGLDENGEYRYDVADEA